MSPINGNLSYPIFIVKAPVSSLMKKLTNSKEYAVTDISPEYAEFSARFDEIHDGVITPDDKYFEENMEPSMDAVALLDPGRSCRLSLAQYCDYSVIECMDFKNYDSLLGLNFDLIKVLRSEFPDFIILNQKKCIDYGAGELVGYDFLSDSDMAHIESETSYPVKGIIDSLDICPLPSKCSKELKIIFP